MRESADNSKPHIVCAGSACDSDNASLKPVGSKRILYTEQAMGGFSKSVFSSIGCLACALLFVWCHENIHVQYCEIMRFMLLHNRHHKMSHSSCNTKLLLFC